MPWLLQIHQTIPETFLLGLVGFLFSFFFFPLLLQLPQEAKAVSPAKEQGEHRAFCPPSIRLGPGTSVSFSFLLFRSPNNEAFGRGSVVREMHSSHNSFLV